MVELRSGVHIACHFSGEPGGQTIVLLHALGEQATSWAAVERQFAPSYRVVNVDLRGHGGSDRPGVYSFELMRDDVIEIFDAFDLREVVLVGHSMGGVVAYLVAQTQPARVSHLVVEDVPPPFPRTRPIPERPDGALDFDWAVVPAIVEQVNDPTRRWWKQLPDIASRTLLIGGGPSSHVPQELLLEVSRLIPDCTLISIPVGHNIHETEPTEFSEVILRWLDDADPVS
ncbi:alpha/beta hydrolase [Salinibacterium sp. ZJ454]|uniref:alpha/beta fold hydrolase n=1 Tax=Salinibacterium sp. ZJ454 TaxID=2708339 RepID=UPI00141E0CFF|nr:alpha/beta hydrolase [Salinibacterium sp. ZJ454]